MLFSGEKKKKKKSSWTETDTAASAREAQTRKMRLFDDPIYHTNAGWFLLLSQGTHSRCDVQGQAGATDEKTIKCPSARASLIKSCSVGSDQKMTKPP